MGFLKNLFGGKNKENNLSKEDLIEANVCPNCWGKQEYQNQFVQFQKDQTKANISHDKLHQKAFIQQFVETNITGIKLKRDGDKMVCNKCNSRF